MPEHPEQSLQGHIGFLWTSLGITRAPPAVAREGFTDMSWFVRSKSPCSGAMLLTRLGISLEVLLSPRAKRVSLAASPLHVAMQSGLYLHPVAWVSGV